MTSDSDGNHSGGCRFRHHAWAAVALCAIFGVVSLLRLIDGDEGFYLVAARMVREGKRPYADFFFLQMPVLPYVLAAWTSVFGAGWYTARILAAILAVVLGLLVFRRVAQRTGSAALAAVALVIFAFSGLSLGWFSAVKTYGLSEVLLFASYLCAVSRRRGALFASGVFLGLATGVRLYLIVAAPCLALYLWRELGPSRSLLRAWGQIVAGIALGLLPCIPFLLRDREAFVFDTFLFHSLRNPDSGESLFGEFGQKWETVLSLLGLRNPESPVGIQFLALTAAAVAGCFLPGAPKNSLARYLWIALGVTSLLPNLTFNQYFCLLVPFMAVSVAEHLHAAWPLRGMRARALALVCIAYACIGLLDAWRYVETGERVVGIMEPSNAVNWTIPTVEEVGRGIDRVGLETGTSWWPGYFAFTRTRIIPEMANDFAIRAAPELTPEQRARYHIVTKPEIGRMLLHGSPRIFVDGNWSPKITGVYLQSFGYRVSQTVGRARIWVHPGPER